MAGAGEHEVTHDTGVAQCDRQSAADAGIVVAGGVTYGHDTAGIGLVGPVVGAGEHAAGAGGSGVRQCGRDGRSRRGGIGEEPCVATVADVAGAQRERHDMVSTGAACALVEQKAGPEVVLRDDLVRVGARHTLHQQAGDAGTRLLLMERDCGTTPYHRAAPIGTDHE